MAIWEDRSSSIEIVSLSKNAKPTSIVWHYNTHNDFTCDDFTCKDSNRFRWRKKSRKMFLSISPGTEPSYLNRAKLSSRSSFEFRSPPMSDQHRNSATHSPPPLPMPRHHHGDSHHQCKFTKPCTVVARALNQGILKGEGSFTVPLTSCLTGLEFAVWQLKFLFLFVKQANPNQSNRRSMVQWYFPL